MVPIDFSGFVLIRTDSPELFRQQELLLPVNEHCDELAARGDHDAWLGIAIHPRVLGLTPRFHDVDEITLLEILH